MFASPQAEHEWLQQLIGQWTFSHECFTGPDQPPSAATGSVEIRSLGGLWILIESTSEPGQHGVWKSLMSLGFDPAKNAFVGTFIGSMMANLWIYEGQLDEARTALTLHVDGPKMEGSGTTSYQDIVEIVSPDHWNLKSLILEDNGDWRHFMTGQHHRIK